MMKNGLTVRSKWSELKAIQEIQPKELAYIWKCRAGERERGRNLRNTQVPRKGPEI